MLCGPACVVCLKDAVKEGERAEGGADVSCELCVTQVEFNRNSDTHFPAGISEQALTPLTFQIHLWCCLPFVLSISILKNGFVSFDLCYKGPLF